MSDSEHKTPWELILTLITLIGVIAFLSKIFGKSEDDKREEAAKKSREETYGEDKLTYKDFQYKDWADAISEAIMPSVDEDEQVVYDVFSRLKTIGDINKVIEYFGTQRRLFTLAWVTLPEAITSYFSQSEKKKLNAIISANGINYEFL